MRALLSEDHPGAAAAIATGLRSDDAAFDVALDGDKALFLARVHPQRRRRARSRPSEVDWAELCRAVHAEKPTTKILMLGSARGTDALIEGLAIGADDYLRKPLRLAELVARMDALARRAGDARPAVLVHGDIELDPARRVAARGGRELDLTRKEFGVLHALMAAGGDVVSAGEPLASMWDVNADPNSSMVRMTVMKLRRELGEPAVVETVARAGYRMRTPSAHALTFAEARS